MGLTLFHLSPSKRDKELFETFEPEVRSYFERGILFGRVLFLVVLGFNAAMFYFLYVFLTSLTRNYVVGLGSWFLLLALWLWTFIISPEITHGRVLDRIPNAPRFPLIGHMYLVFTMVQREALDLMVQQCKNTVAGLVPIFFVGFRAAVLIIDPDAIREILTTDFREAPKNDAIRFFYPWLGKGLLTSGGDHWKLHRRLLTPAFHFGALQKYFEIELKHVKVFKSIIEKRAEEQTPSGYGVPFDIVPLISYYTLDVISESAFGYISNSQFEGDSEFVRAVNVCCSTCGFHAMQRPFIPEFIWHNFFPSGRAFLKAKDVCHRISEAVIEKRKKELELKEEAERLPADFLDILLMAKDEESGDLSDQDIKDEVNTFIFEGFDTTATALTWMIYEISNNPHVEARIVEEINEVLGDRSYPTYEDMKKLKYIEMVAKETLRLHPSVYLFGRYTLKDIHVGEYTIPKNTEVAMLPYVVHRMPQYWESPEVFDPERFSPERQAKQHPFQYIPFSAGSRNCIGQKFALDEIRTTIATLYKDFHFDVVSPEMVAHEPMVVLKTRNGLKVIATPRSKLDASSSTLIVDKSTSTHSTAKPTTTAKAATATSATAPSSSSMPHPAFPIGAAPGAGVSFPIPSEDSPKSRIVETHQPNAIEIAKHQPKLLDGIFNVAKIASVTLGIALVTIELGKRMVFE